MAGSAKLEILMHRCAPSAVRGHQVEGGGEERALRETPNARALPLEPMVEEKEVGLGWLHRKTDELSRKFALRPIVFFLACGI